MTQMIKCPICNDNIKWEYWTGVWGIEEEQIYCQRCGYGYEFAYGGYFEWVKGKEYIWSYRTKWGDPVHKRIKRDTFMARRNWKKFRKAYKMVQCCLKLKCGDIGV